jgi:streptogramin lyase
MKTLYRGMHYIMLGCVAAVLSIVPSVVQAKSPPPGAAGADVAANILLMLDTSGSMGWSAGATIQYPRDLDFDSAGNIYVATYRDGIMKFSSTGALLAQWGTTYGGGNGDFRRPYSIELDGNDNVYVSDGDNGRVQKFDVNGTYLDKFNVTTSYSRGISADSSGNVYVVNSNGRVEKYNSSGTYVSTWANTGAYYIDVGEDDNVYVAKFYSNSVEKYDTDGNFISSFGTGANPYGVQVKADGTIAVSRYYSNSVEIYNAAGTFQSSESGFYYPRGVAEDSSGNFVVADYYNHRVVGYDGTVLVSQESRMDQMKLVIKNITSNSDLTSGANFGLLTWSSSGTGNVVVDVSPTGAGEIYAMIDGVNASGGTYLGSAMSVAQSYFTGSNSPRDSGASCQQNIIIVISDGEWSDNPDTTAETLFDTYNIRTFTVGFLTTGNANYTSLSTAGGTFPESPLFAENYQNLIDVLSDYILQIISSQLTFSAPTIVPGVENDDHILQSTFNYNSDHQWKGHLFKYALADTGLLGGQIWDAGSVLNNTDADDRKLWTVGNGLPTGYNNFVDTYFDELRPLIEENSGTSYTDDEISEIINYVRGEDVYNEYPSGTDEEGTALRTGERWKLADIYNSRASVVGPPKDFSSDEVNSNSEAYYRYVNGYRSFRSSSSCGGACTTREEMVYVGSNGGMVHAIQSADGVEKWGFIPPSVMANFKDIVSADAGTSGSVYGVDGSPTIKDVYYDNAWHTVLMIGLRQGGHSYSALDITNPDLPTHLFTFSYNPLNNKVHYWADDGTETSYTVGVDTIPAEFDFSDLGEAWSQPVIVKAPLGLAGADKWVALVGGGYNSGVNPNYGSSLFIIDIENGGEILQKIDVGDASGSNGIVNALPPRVTAITADSSNLVTGNGALVYFSDLEGNIWKINLTSTGTLYSKNMEFNNQGNATNERFSYFGTQASVTSEGYLVNLSGTGNMQQLENTGSGIENRAYALFDKNFPGVSGVSTPITDASLQDVTIAGTSCPSAVQHGWLIEMDANEKVTAPITVKNNYLYVSRFTPDSTDICAAGSGRLTEHLLDCGAKTEDTDLGSGLATEAVVYKNKVYIGISNDADVTLSAGWIKEGNLIVGSPSELTEATVKVESWWEEF